MNRKLALVLSALVAVVFALATIYIVRTHSRVASGAQIRVGAILPLTGETAEYGTRCKDGIALAVGEINSHGGVNGVPIRVTYEDYRGEAKEAVSSLYRLVSQDHVAALIGPVESSVAQAILPIINQYKLPTISPTASSPDLSGKSKYFFRLWPSDAAEANAMARFTYNQLGLRRIVVFFVNNDYGIGLMRGFQAAFSSLGGQILRVEAYKQGDSNLRPALEKLNSLQPQGIYMVGYHKDLALSTKLFREIGGSAQILGSANYGTDELLRIAGSSAEGAIYANPTYDPQQSTPSVKAFRLLFKEHFQREPTIFEANGYDSLTILANAFHKEDTTGEQVSAYISSLSGYQGASGILTMDKYGNVSKPISIFTVRNGKFIQYQVLATGGS
jgi:branched-chain amino acid transport system substrate-binding protein